MSFREYSSEECIMEALFAHTSQTLGPTSYALDSPIIISGLLIMMAPHMFVQCVCMYWDVWWYASKVDRLVALEPGKLHNSDLHTLSLIYR